MLTPGVEELSQEGLGARRGGALVNAKGERREQRESESSCEPREGGARVEREPEGEGV